LEALYAVGSEKTHEYALAFLDTIDANPMGNSGYAPIPLEQKVRATGVLFKLGDYSTYEYVFQMLDEYSSWLNSSYAVDLLPEIIKNIPAERERTKNDLVNKTLRRMLYNDTVATIRKQVAENLLFRHGTHSDYKFVKEYLVKESDTVIKNLIESDLEDFKLTILEDTTKFENCK